MKTKIIIAVIVIAVLLVSGSGIYIYLSHKSKPTLTTSSHLTKVIEKYDLETVDYTYNSIATRKNEDKEEYYVRYDGDVKLGVDLSQVTFDVDEKNKSIVVNVPKATVQSIKAEPVDFIFTKNKYETETVIVEARKLCKEDLENKVKSNAELYNRAWENSTTLIDGIISPFSDGYTVQYVPEGGADQ